ncbi:MAG: hypothetical protein ACXIUZ_08725 [Lysobacteraceae bacterium]
MDREQALRANRSGAVAACIVATFTAVVVVMAMQADPVAGGIESYFADPVFFLDVGLMLLCAYGMYRNSRTAAVFVFGYYVVAKVATTVATGQVIGIGAALIFLYFFGRAIQGTFAFHRIEKATNPGYRSAPGWLVWVSVPVIGVLVVLTGFGALSMTSLLPSTQVQSGEQITSRDIATLREAGILVEDETVEHFYSYGLFSILEGGNLVTNLGVVIYYPEDGGELTVAELPFGKIASVEKIEDGGVLSHSVYRVNGFDEDNWLLLELSTESRGDVRFVQAIRDRMRAP